MSQSEITDSAFRERRNERAGTLRLSPALRRSMDAVSFPRDSVLVRQGEEAQRLFLITSGTVKVLLGAGSDARVIARIGRGAWIGETALLTGAVSSTTVVAEDDVRALAVSQHDFLAAADEDPAIFREVARELAHRLRSTDEFIDRAPRSRVVGLCHDSEHAGVAERVIADCRTWSGGTHLSIALGRGLASPSEPTVRDYAIDPALLSALRTRVAARARVALYVGDATHEDIDGFLRTATEFTELIVVHGEVMPQAVRLHLAHLVSIGARFASDACEPAVERQDRIVVDARFDAGRVARRLCGRSVGVAFGGGGARGFAHIGALRVLLNAGVPIDAVSGTSVGAGVAACVAAGFSADEIAESIAMGGRGALVPSLPPIHSTFSSASVERELRRQFEGCTFADLSLPMGVVAVDLLSGEEVTFVGGPLVPALMASMAVPGIFPPVRHDGRLLVDGALHAPVPVDACRAVGADIVIASQMRIGSSVQPGRRRAMPWMPEVITSALDIMQDHIAAESVNGADVRIETVVPRELGGLFDFSHRAALELAGEEAARRVRDQLTSLVPAAAHAA